MRFTTQLTKCWPKWLRLLRFYPLPWVLLRLAKANALPNLTDEEKAESEAQHLLGGMHLPPSNAANEPMIHQITWYDDDLRVPLWVAYELTNADASAQLLRKAWFRKDPRLSDEAASCCEDYEEPIFDRGHIVPNADLNRGRLPQTNGFISKHGSAARSV